MKLTTRFFLILLFIAVVPLSVSIVWNLRQFKSTTESFFELHRGLANLASSNVEEWFAGLNRSLAFLYEIDSPVSSHRVNEMKIIQQATATNSDIVALNMISKEGIDSFSLQSEKIKSEKPLIAYQENLIKDARTTGKVALGEVICINSQPYFPLAYPLMDGRTVLLHFSLDKVWRRTNFEQTGKTGKVLLVKTDGSVLPCQTIAEKDISSDELKAVFQADRKEGTFIPKGGTIKSLNIGKVKHAGAYSRIEKLPWFLISVQSHSELYGPQRRSVLVFVGFSIMVLLTSVVVVYMISKKILKPISALMEGVQRVSSSDLTTTIPQEGWPEIKSLISVFNRMMLELQAYRAFQLRKLVEEKTKAEALINTIPDGVILVDQNNRLMSSNQIALKLMGIPKVSPDIVLPKSVRNVDFFKEISNVLSSKEKFVSAELVSTISQNPPITKNFRILSNQYMLETLKKPGRILIIRDITTEKELEKAKEDFFHMITHDMRAPLASIQGYIELLKKTIPPSEKTEKFISNMLFSSRRLRGMIDDILNITKLERGTMMLQLDNVSVSEFLIRIRDNFEPVSNPKNIKVVVVPPKQEISFKADPILIERVVSNLVGNALKFTPSGGTITLSADENEQEVFLWVQDTGPGIPEDKRKSIFEKYSQLEEHKQMGFGLGLAMCRMAVELHKGRIWVESEVGKGSTFIFTISKSL